MYLRFEIHVDDVTDVFFSAICRSVSAGPTDRTADKCYRHEGGRQEIVVDKQTACRL